MDKIKSINWKIVVYWFVTMSLMNVYIVPKYINNEPITTKRVVIGLVVSLIVALLMGLLTVPKPEEKQK